MKKIKMFFWVFLSVMFFVSCEQNLIQHSSKPPVKIVHKTVVTDTKTITIIPLGYVHPQYLEAVKSSVKEFYGYDCVISNQIELTNDVLSPSKQKYESSKILKKYDASNHRILVTEKDISFDCWVSPEYSVFGLAHRPGDVCVVSTHRLKDKNDEVVKTRLKKVVVHELGHNFGTQHCELNYQCLMYNVDGSVAELDREKMIFCDSCRSQLKK